MPGRRVEVDRATKLYIEKQLEDYPKMDEYIQNRKLELKYPSIPKDDNIDAPKGTGVSNPIERMIVTIDSDKRLKQLENTKKAIESTLNKLDASSYSLVELKYWKKPQTLTWLGIAEKVGYSRRQCFNVRDSIIQSIAKELGLN